MVANHIALLRRLPHKCWIHLHLLSKAEKRGVYAILLKHAQDQWGKERLWSIIERQGYGGRCTPSQAMLLRTW
jgi:hypothetical protein